MQASSTQPELRVRVPEKIQVALEAYATEHGFSIDTAIELAIASFLDVDAVTYDGCQPVTTPGQLREENEILKYRLAKRQ
jgi:hypothetical protein